MTNIYNLVRAVAVTVLLFFAESCFFAPSVAERLSDTIEYVESAESMTTEEWEVIKEEYYMTVDEFRANIDSYTEKEKQEIYGLIGKMNGIIAKREAGQAIGRFNEILESLPSMLDGFVEGITGGEN